MVKSFSVRQGNLIMDTPSRLFLSTVGYCHCGYLTVKYLWVVLDNTILNTSW
jgi:hypothetical protein